MSEDIRFEQFEEDDEVYDEDRVEVEENEHDGGNVSEAEEAREGNQEEDPNKKTVKPKRVIRNPQPKLNEETLKGKKGLTALPSYFERIRYKGKSHEEEDLNMILKTYEYWCHRLFPKYPFDDCLAKIEKLGSKRAVVTHIKKIRLNMMYGDQPIVNNDSDSEEDKVNDDGNNDSDLIFPDIQTSVEITEEQQEQITLNKERAERLRREKLQREQERSSSQASDVELHILTSEAGTSQVEPSVELTEEQQERIRQNRERAERRRQKRLEKLESSAINTLNENLEQLSSTQSSEINVQDAVPLDSHANMDTACNEDQYSGERERSINEKTSSCSGPTDDDENN